MNKKNQKKFLDIVKNINNKVSLNKEEISLFEKEIFTILKNYKNKEEIKYADMQKIFYTLGEFYSKNENENTSVPAGPDTSKFTATKSGKINIKESFKTGETQYSNGQYFAIGLQIGTNYTYGNPYILAESVLKYIEKEFNLCKYSDGKQSYIKNSHGTSWGAIGIG